MSSELDVLGYFIPLNILCQIFAEFLSVNDICLFDSVCNKNRRLLYLECLRSNCFVFPGDEYQDLSLSAISWLKSRSIKIQHLKCGQMTDEIFVGMGSFGSLHWLITLDLGDIYSGNLNVRDISIIRVAEECPNLIRLDLTECRRITDLSILKIAERCPKLQSLSLMGCFDVTDTSIIAVAEGCPNLSDLDLSICKTISDFSIIRLALKCPNLRNLNLSECDNVTDECILWLAAGCSKMESLNLNECNKLYDAGIAGKNITDFSICCLSSTCPNLKSLNLSSCYGISDMSIGMVANNCPNLYLLDVSYTKVSDASLFFLRLCRNLRILNLDVCDVSEMGIITLVETDIDLLSLKLHLDHPYTNGGIIRIAEASRNLNEFVVSGEAVEDGLSDELEIRVKEICPNLKRLLFQG